MNTKTESKSMVENPVSGHRVIYLQTAKETNGELLQILNMPFHKGSIH